MGKEILTWENIETLSNQLVSLIKDSEEKFTDIIALARGGLFPATLLAYGLGIRNFHTLAVASYEQDKQGDLSIKGGLPQLSGDNILIVDDLADTGKTLSYIKGLYPDAKVACLLTKPQGKGLVDFVVQEYAQDIWVDFPWEKNEQAGLSYVSKSICSQSVA